MKKQFKKIIFVSQIVILAFSVIIPLNAQETLSSSQISINPETLDDLKKQVDQGKNETDRNLPVSRMAKELNSESLKPIDQQKKQKINPNTTNSSITAKENKSLLNHYYETLTQEQLDIFGKAAFQKDENSLMLFYNTPGEYYKLAPGDIVQVIIRGLSSANEKVQVDNLGQITLSIINPFYAHGKTLEEVRSHILNELKTEDASASAYVTLSAARLIQVKVTGEVKHPQTIAVPAYTPLSQVLSRVGGINDMGSLRNIVLTNSLQGRKKIDLYKLLRDSEDFEDHLLITTSRVHVNDLGSTVAVSGFVGRPRIFELPSGANKISISKLLEHANSKLTPHGTNIEILKFDSQGIVRSTPINSVEGLTVQSGEALRLTFSKTRNLKEISVVGEVISPFKVTGKQSGVSLLSLLKKGAVLKKAALKNIALLHSKTGVRKVINLNHVLDEKMSVQISPGETLEILSPEAYFEILKTSKLETASIQANEIFLNEERIALIPEYPKQSIQDTINSLYQVRSSDAINKDFAYIISKKNTQYEQIKAINLGHTLRSQTPVYLEDNSQVYLFTYQYLAEKLSKFDELSIDDYVLAKIKKTNPLEVFLDGKRIGILPSSSILSETDLSSELRSIKNLYPLFARITNHNQTNTRIERSFINTNLANIIFKDSNFQTKPGQRIDIFSTPFVRNLFSEKEQKKIDSLQLSISSTDEILEGTKEIEETRYTLAALKRASRLITGAVENPGFYPISSEVSLSDLINVAGGSLPGSDLSRITIRKYAIDADGISDISEVIMIDGNSVNMSELLLSKNFDVTIPSFVNDAAIGIINIEGEVQRPGEYLVSRNETLTQVIKRAGGFTKIAYPLGINFSRENLKVQERQTNLFLANKLEQSIVSLSQNQKEGAGEQINAVLAYAQQLRTLEVNGRQTVNYANLYQTDNIYLDDGDTIFIPKRPSHVTITGRVQNATIASYEKGKKIEDYIDDAGGLDRIADIKNIFVTLPNGQSLTIERLKDSGGIIPPGSVIIIPPKTDKLSLLGLTEVFSKVLGNIATSILAINAVSN